NNMSSLEVLKNNYGDALEYSFKAIGILDTTDNYYLQGMAYTNLANVYEADKELEKAENWYRKAQSKLSDDPYRIATIKENLGVISVNKEDYSSALNYFNSAISTYEEYGDTHGLAQLNNSIGATYFKLNNINKAKQYYYKSAKLAEKVGNNLLLGDAYVNLGILFVNSGIVDSATFYGIKVEEILEDSIGGPSDKRVGAILFSNIYESNGQFKEALHFLKKAYNINNGINEKEKTEKLAQEKAKREYVESQIVIQRQFYINIILALAILFCAAGLFFLFRTGRSKAKELQRLIETKDLEFITAKLKGEQLGRDKVARQLHDDVSPTTVAIKREIEIAKKNTHDLEAMLNSLNIAMSITDKVYEKTRQLAYELKTKPLDWLDDIKFDINQLQREDIESQIIVHEIDESINERIGTEVSKILNVLLHNVRKHARASKVSVDLTRISDELVIIIEDNGIGFNTNSKPGLGLRSVKARVKDLKGEINMDSEMGKGTTIVVNIPLSGAAILQSN
ncbi:MAG: tetratricopeptide repeat protein, partial [Bacteroidota bacterium]